MHAVRTTPLAPSPGSTGGFEDVGRRAWGHSVRPWPNVGVNRRPRASSRRVLRHSMRGRSLTRGSTAFRRRSISRTIPWNPAFKSQWFLDALPLYDRVFTPRRSNVADLIRHGCRSVEFLPFGFDQELFFPDPPPAAEVSRYAADVFFAGGADKERRPFLAALVANGVDVALYGDYWERFAETRHVTRGHGSPKELRHAIAASKVCLGLVRRANRDGHAMRSIEVPAAGGCFLVERTREHEDIFGPDGDAVTYFDDIDGMVRETRRLLEDGARRERLRARALDVIARGQFTYEDRLRTLMGQTAPVEAR